MKILLNCEREIELIGNDVTDKEKIDFVVNFFKILLHDCILFSETT